MPKAVESPTSPPSPPFGPQLWPMWFALVVMCLGARLPWALQRLLGRVIGVIALRVAGSRRRAAQINLALCFPEKTPAERDRMLRESFRDLGIGLFEFARAWWGSAAPWRGLAGRACA